MFETSEDFRDKYEKAVSYNEQNEALEGICCDKDTSEELIWFFNGIERLFGQMLNDGPMGAQFSREIVKAMLLIEPEISFLVKLSKTGLWDAATQPQDEDIFINTVKALSELVWDSFENEHTFPIINAVECYNGYLSIYKWEISMFNGVRKLVSPSIDFDSKYLTYSQAAALCDMQVESLRNELSRKKIKKGDQKRLVEFVASHRNFKPLKFVDSSYDSKYFKIRNLGAHGNLYWYLKARAEHLNKTDELAPYLGGNIGLLLENLEVISSALRLDPYTLVEIALKENESNWRVEATRKLELLVYHSN